jgi:hypothetical protein
MTSTLPIGTLGSVASLLAATLYQGNPDRNHKLWNCISVPLPCLVRSGKSITVSIVSLIPVSISCYIFVAHVYLIKLQILIYDGVFYFTIILRTRGEIDHEKSTY